MSVSANGNSTQALDEDDILLNDNEENPTNSFELRKRSETSTPVASNCAASSNKTCVSSASSQEQLVPPNGPSTQNGHIQMSRHESESGIPDGASYQALQPLPKPSWLPPSYNFDGLITNWWLWELSSLLVA